MQERLDQDNIYGFDDEYQDGDNFGGEGEDDEDN